MLVRVLNAALIFQEVFVASADVPSCRFSCEYKQKECTKECQFQKGDEKDACEAICDNSYQKCYSDCANAEAKCVPEVTKCAAKCEKSRWLKGKEDCFKRCEAKGQCCAMSGGPPAPKPEPTPEEATVTLGGSFCDKNCQNVSVDCLIGCTLDKSAMSDQQQCRSECLTAAASCNAKCNAAKGACESAKTACKYSCPNASLKSDCEKLCSMEEICCTGFPKENPPPNVAEAEVALVETNVEELNIYI